MDLNLFIVRPLVRAALSEDIGYGDLATMATIPEKLRAKAVLKAKEKGIIAGMPVFQLVYEELDGRVEVTAFMGEGEMVAPGDTLAEVTGPAAAILTGKRVALNFLQRMSGIATKAHKLVDLTRYYDCHIVDTRKTTPGLRVVEKYAVRVGGARNHRYSLSDAILITDNHVEIAGGLKNAVIAVRQRIGPSIKIEVETSTLALVHEALDVGVDIIMLDNMSIQNMTKAVKLVDGRAIVEASGCIDEDNVVEVAKIGVDIISCGSLTHSYKALDISLNVNYQG